MKKLFCVLLILCFLSFPSETSAGTVRLCPNQSRTVHAVSKKIGGWKKIDYIMWRESRCNPRAVNPKDPYGGSLGLFQINQFWCKPSRSTGNGILVEWNILSSCDELHKPQVSARAFVAIYKYVENHYGDGWIPWGGDPWN
jgi:hypothetical protein